MTADRPTETFTQWLLHHQAEETPVGDLARDVAADTEWPDSDPLPDLHAYLDEMAAVDGAHHALDAAWRRYAETVIAAALAGEVADPDRITRVVGAALGRAQILPQVWL